MFLTMILIITFLVICEYTLRQKARRYSHLPGDLGSPIFGNLICCIKNSWYTTHHDFNECIIKYAKRFGGVCCFWFYNQICVYITDPIIAENITSHSGINNKAPIVFDNVSYFMKNTFAFTETNREWKMRRKEMTNSLKKQNLESYLPMIINSAKKAVNMLSKHSGEFNCHPPAMQLTLEVTLETFFGIQMDLSDDKDLTHDLHFSSRMITNILSNPILGTLSILVSKYIYFPAAQKKFENSVFQKIISIAKECNYDKDVNSKILEGDNLPLAVAIAHRNLLRNASPQEQRAEMAEVLYVGAHTLGQAVNSCLVCMATNPVVQEKLWLEQREMFGDSNREATHDDIKRMVYLERFYKEVLRFVAPPLIARIASQELIIDDLMIPEGAMVMIGTLQMRRDSMYWENPELFDPDRFLNETIFKTPKAASTFFGFGVRGCPGSQFANFYIKILLSTIIRNLKLYSSKTFSDIHYKYSIMVEMEGHSIGVEKRK